MIATTKAPVICWFRQDLRLSDNPALSAAVSSGRPVLPIYILDDANAGEWAMGAASRWWLHQSLNALHASLDGALHCFTGKADKILPELAQRFGASRAPTPPPGPLPTVGCDSAAGIARLA